MFNETVIEVERSGRGGGSGRELEENENLRLSYSASQPRMDTIIFPIEARSFVVCAELLLLHKIKAE